MKNLIIIGAGGFGREVLWLINDINRSQDEWEVVGFLDDDDFFEGKIIEGYHVLGRIEKAIDFQNTYFVLAIGNPSVKEKIIQKLPNDAQYATLIHPSVLIGERIKVGEGSVLCAYSVLTVDIEIGDHVILNLCCTVGHDTRIDDFTSFMPSVNISGEVIIEKAVYVGTGAKIINQLSIGAYTVVGAGAVVSKSLPPNCTAVGIPAKPIKFHDER